MTSTGFQQYLITDRFRRAVLGLARPAVCAGKGAAIHSYIFWVLLLTTTASSGNYNIIENDLKPSVRALPVRAGVYRKQLLK